jgi:aryl sulfotransferase
LSPWLDHLVEPLDEVVARLDAQTHRRVIKTHTPLDGVPLKQEVTYIVIARHPLDAADNCYRSFAQQNASELADLLKTQGAPVIKL